jgi:hypothetical protein
MTGAATVISLVGKLWDAEGRRIEFGAFDATGRVGARLVEMVQCSVSLPEGVGIALPLPQDELAGSIGSSREACRRRSARRARPARSGPGGCRWRSAISTR